MGFPHFSMTLALRNPKGLVSKLFLKNTTPPLSVWVFVSLLLFFMLFPSVCVHAHTFDV